MTQHQPRLEEQLVSKAVELGLSSLLTEAEDIDIDVHTNLFEIVQGEADAVSLVGKGLVMQKDIRLHYIALETDNIDIDVLKAITDKPELEHPVNATARVVLLEQDINRTLNSEYVRSKMQNFELNVDGRTVNLEMQQMELRLPGNGKMIFNGSNLVHERGKTQSVSFTSAFFPRTDSHPPLLEAFHCTDGTNISLEVTVALMQKVKELTHLNYFDLEQVAFRIKKMEVKEGCIVLEAEAQVRKLPHS